MRDEDLAQLREFGVATIYEASGREGLIDLPLIQLIPGSRAAGPARTVLCGQDDNLMVHAVIEGLRPGEVLVLTMPDPHPVAVLGELLATQVKARGAAAILVDAAVRDVEDLVKLGVPIWTRFIRARGAARTCVGKIGIPVQMGGTAIAPGDIIVLDADGAVCIQRQRLEDVLTASAARYEREAILRQRLNAGEMSFDVHGLRDVVEKQRGNP